MSAKLEYRQVKMYMALGIKTVGELLAYLKARETSRIVKNPNKHCIKKYKFNQLQGEWI